MKSIDKTFSLFDFCKKKASKVQIYGEETLDDDGNIISFIVFITIEQPKLIRNIRV